jgi:MFS family permease
VSSAGFWPGGGGGIDYPAFYSYVYPMPEGFRSAPVRPEAAFFTRWSGGLIHRYGARRPLTIGPVIVAAGSALFALPGIGGSYWTTFFPAMVVLGLGMAVSVAPLTTTVMSAAGIQHAGTASGINNAISRIAGTLAVALLGALVVGVFGATVDRRLAELQVPPEIRRALHAEVPKFAEAKVPSQIEGEQRRMLEKVLDESFVRSFRVATLVAASLALTSALCAGLMIRPQCKKPPGTLEDTQAAHDHELS